MAGKRIKLIDSYIPPRDPVVTEALGGDCGKLVGRAAPRSVAELPHRTRELDFCATRYVIELTGRCATCSAGSDLGATIAAS